MGSQQSVPERMFGNHREQLQLRDGTKFHFLHFRPSDSCKCAMLFLCGLNLRSDDPNRNFLHSECAPRYGEQLGVECAIVTPLCPLTPLTAHWSDETMQVRRKERRKEKRREKKKRKEEKTRKRENKKRKPKKSREIRCSLSLLSLVLLNSLFGCNRNTRESRWQVSQWEVSEDFDCCVECLQTHSSHVLLLPRLIPTNDRTNCNFRKFRSGGFMENGTTRLRRHECKKRSQEVLKDLLKLFVFRNAIIRTQAIACLKGKKFTIGFSVTKNNNGTVCCFYLCTPL